MGDISFEISIDQRFEHYYTISMEFITDYNDPIIELPTWTPGSYLIRDYSRHVQELKAHVDEVITKSEKVSKNRWKIYVDKGRRVKISYKLYSFDLTVRTNYLSDRFGLLVGCASFFYPVDEHGNAALKSRISVRINLPGNWQVFTSLKSEEGIYFADDYDELFDSPIGFAMQETHISSTYDFNGVPNTVAIIGEIGDIEISKFVEDLQKLQKEAVRMFGELPYDRYVWILYVVGKGGGGLEHKYSNVSIIDRFAASDDKSYKGLLRLESHEHFHSFNVKRVRPEVLGPFNYAGENYTTALWIAEGVTSYYESLYLVRSGIISREEYVMSLEEGINKYLNHPGRKIHSVAEASFDAWIKLYKADENFINSSISYYLKGRFVALCLDMHIRIKSEGKKSLDDVYVYLWGEYKKDKTKGFPEEEFPMIIEEVTGVDVKEYFSKYIYGTDELPLKESLSYIGIDFNVEEIENKDLDGVSFKESKIQSISSMSAWAKSGLSPKDEIISINDFDARKSSNREKILRGRNDGDKLIILVFRDGKLLTYTGKFKKWRSEVKLKLAKHPELYDHYFINSFSSN